LEIAFRDILKKSDLKNISELNEISLLYEQYRQKRQFFSKAADIIAGDLTLTTFHPIREGLEKKMKNKCRGKQSGVKFDLSSDEFVDLSLKPYVEFSVDHFFSSYKEKKIKFKFKLDFSVNIKDIEIKYVGESKSVKLGKLIARVTLSIRPYGPKLGEKDFSVNLSKIGFFSTSLVP